MPIVTIRNIPVKFPFPPYDIQIAYMEKVIDCLQNRRNGILESPTGTGKTLSLLCASLAWLEHRKAEFLVQTIESESDDDEDCSNNKNERLKVPTIVYASRTHSQIYQAMQEMKRTDYNHMKAIALGSRAQMCINEEVVKEKDATVKVHLCRAKVKHKACLYHDRVEKSKVMPEVTEANILDIEDIVDLGQSLDFCPYFMARQLKPLADVVFMPYNYLLDPQTRSLLDCNFHNCIIILDEAHNVEKVCEESASVRITSADVTSGIEDITALIDAIAENKLPPEEEIFFSLFQLRQLNEVFIKFNSALLGIKIKTFTDEGKTFPGDYIYTMLGNAGVDGENAPSLRSLIELVTLFFSTSKHLPGKGYALNVFFNLLNIAFYEKTPEFIKKIQECFKVYIADETAKKGFGSGWLSQATQQENYRVLNFWCFSPGFAMKMLLDQGVHCVILTSGTLAPLKPLINELEIDIGVQIENPHIVKGDQVCVKILTTGPDMEPLNSNFQNRNNAKYLQSLGLVISNLVRVIPDGVLIFFPSYGVMETCRRHWENSGIWDGIYKTKPIFVEPKDKASFDYAMNEYYTKINDPNYKGAIFMGVCRGKVSEGLDFADVNGRAVFITGLPFPPLKDPKVILKKQYLDFKNSQDREYLRGQEWYSLEATRAINQAVGRVIRHRNDYGAIILLDARFTNYNIQRNMSKWLHEHIKPMKNFGEITRHLRSFFINAKENLPIPKTMENIKQEVVDIIEIKEEPIEVKEEPIEDANYCDMGLVKIHKKRVIKYDLDSSPKKLK